MHNGIVTNAIKSIRIIAPLMASSPQAQLVLHQLFTPKAIKGVVTLCPFQLPLSQPASSNGMVANATKSMRIINPFKVSASNATAESQSYTFTDFVWTAIFGEDYIIFF